MKPSVLILRSAGTNCDKETAHAFELAGGQTSAVHVRALIDQPALLDRHQVLALPGGFSYGDDISSGRILANQLSARLMEPLRRFVESGRPIIGICNGFQVLVKTELLPGPLAGYSGQTATLTHNTSHRFIDRWATLGVTPSPCIWTSSFQRGNAFDSAQSPLPVIELPIAHGEGRFVCANADVRQALHARSQVALVYARPDGTPAGADPAFNPNGSEDDIAGVCDQSGFILGLMPHPERHVSIFQHPAWTSRRLDRHDTSEEAVGLEIFRNAVRHCSAVGV